MDRHNPAGKGYALGFALPSGAQELREPVGSPADGAADPSGLGNSVAGLAGLMSSSLSMSALSWVTLLVLCVLVLAASPLIYVGWLKFKRWRRRKVG